MKKIFAISLLALIFLFTISSFSQAAGLVPCGGNEEPACKFCHFFIMFQNIIDFVLQLVAIIGVLMLVVGGVMFFFGGTSPNMLSKGKEVIKSTLIGLAIIFGAWLIINTFFTFIGVQSWTGLQDNWWNFGFETICE